MTKEQFDDYKFGNKTEVLYRDKWYKITSVDFEYRLIEIITGLVCTLSMLKDIRENKPVKDFNYNYENVTDQNAFLND